MPPIFFYSKYRLLIIRLFRNACLLSFSFFSSMQISPFLPTIMANCETISTDSKSDIEEILKEAKESHQNSIKILINSKKYLTKMYDDLSSSYDNLCRQTNENIDVIEDILASGLQCQDLLGNSTVLETLKSSLSLPSHKFLEEMITAKRKQLAEAHQVSRLPNLKLYPL